MPRAAAEKGAGASLTRWVLVYSPWFGETSPVVGNRHDVEEGFDSDRLVIVAARAT